MWRAFGLMVLLVGCGDNGGPSTIDAGIDGGSGATGTHVFQVDFANGTPDPTGNWVLVPFSAQNLTLPAIRDFATGQATTMSLTTAGFLSQGYAAENWTAGDIDWLLAVVAQDAFGGSVMPPGTATVANLDGRYRVEVVVAYGFATTAHRV